MTREQENYVEALCLRHQGNAVSIREGFADASIVVTLPGGECEIVNYDGIPKSTHPNHSINWSEL